ncbi:uncharacterized protein LOC120355258 isoform X3 [Nilaparvata lugens]|uniref:uncharacterized protein LOC120355258 isoform X2 n=1 Tax=Nilaparvata lugens TaxID=108931 RepID=UPI00193E6621|nr:uncharacterized protein LOC120355258 isoform X2 [Nilaparvata lugens]XP_039299536.1 uncharacterized protein LOC120355258 isoform X3 [Nilaparvata lugens]
METLIVSAYPADLRHRFRIKEAVKKPAKEEEKTPTEVEEKSSKEETRGEATYAYTDEVSDFVKKCQVKVVYSPDFRFTRRKHYFTSFYKRLNKKAEDNRLELERSRTEATNGSFVTLEDKLKVLEDMMLTVTAEELKVVESKMEREKEVKVGEEVNEGESRVKSTILDKDGFSGTKNCSDGKGKNSLMWKRLKELLEENNAPKTWADIKITSQKHPIDPSCYGKEVIRKIIHKKKPKRRLKVPFTRGSRLPQRLSRELYEQISSSESSQNVGIKKHASQNDEKSSQNVGIEKQPSQNDEKSSQNVGMILNIGRQRPLYHEQFEYLQSFENANFISADWAKLAASAVQPSPTSCKVSRLLIPVLCDKLVKLIECQDELKKFDKNVEYGMERLDMDGEEEEEERKEEEEEKKKVKRKSAISSVVKGVVAKLVDTVVADEEDLNLDEVVSQRRVGRELKRLNASLIEVEEEAARPPDDADNNLAKVEKEYHQTVFKKKDKIIFMKGNNKRARRRPMKLDDHVFEVGEENEVEEEEATKRSRIDPAKEYKTDLIRQVEASVEHELSNPPIRDCFVKLVNAKLDQLQKPSAIVNDSDETSENPTPIVNNSDETYVEEICSLPKFNLKVPEHVTRPPLYKIGCDNDVGPSKCKKRKIEESEMVNSSPLSSIVRTKDLNGLKLGSLSSNSDLPAVQQKRVLLNNNSSHNSKVVPDAQKRIKTLKPVLTPRNNDQQPTIPSPDKDGSPKRIKTLQPALPSPDKDGSPKRIKTLQPALPSPGQDGSPKRIKTLQPALPSFGKDGSPKLIKTLQPALPSPGKDGSPKRIKTLQPALPSPGKDGSPKRIKTLLPVLTPRNVDQQPAIPSPDKHDKDGILLPVLSTVNVCSNLALPEADEAAPVAKRLKSMEPEPKLAIKIHSVVSLSGGTINPFENNSPPKTNGLVVPTEVRFKEIAGDFEKTTYNNKDVVSRSQYEFGIHILKRDSFSEMVYMPYAYDMKHNEDGYFGMYFHRGTPDTVMVGPFQTNEDPQIFVHRGRNPVCVTLANKWCEDKDFLDTFWNCHNKVLLKHIVKYAYANRAYVYKTRKPQPKFINIIRRSLNVSNHQTLNSTRNLCAEPAPPVELESTESKKVDVDPVEDGENNRVRSLKPAPPVELESTESKKVDVDPVEDGENNRVRSLKKAEAVGKSEHEPMEPKAGENTQVRSLKKAEAENPETGDQVVNDNGCEPEAGTPNKDGECTTDKVKEAKRESKSVTPISEQPTLSDHLIEKERQFFEFARKLNTLALNSVKLSVKNNEMNQSVKDNVKLSFKNNEMNQSVKDNVELTSVAKKKKKTVTFADELLLVMPESPKKVDADTELVKQNSLPVRKDVKIVGFDKGNPEVIEKNNAAEIDSHLIKQNALSVCKDLEIVRKVDDGTKIENKNLVEAGVKDLDIIIRKFDAKGNVVSEVEKKGNAAEIDSRFVSNNALSVRKDSEIKKHFNKIEIKNKNAVEAGGRDFDIIIRNVDEKGKVVSEVEKKSNAAEIDSCLVRKNAISVRKDLEIVRKGDNITEINNKNAVEGEGSDLVIWVIDDKGNLVKKNALLQKNKVDHTSNNRKDTNPIEPKVIETIDLCESEPTVPNVTLTETRAEPTERDMSKKSAKVAKSIEKQPKVERKIYPTIGFRKIEPKPTTLFFDKGTSKMFFRVDNAKSILNLEKLQTPNSAKQTEAVEVHNPVITTPTQAKKPATNQIQTTKVIEPTKSTNQVQVLPTTSSSAASKSTIKMQAKNPATNEIQATKVIEATKSTNQVQVLQTTSSSAASKFTIQFQTRNPATNIIQATKVIETTNSTNKDQCLPKVIQIPRFLIPNAANGSPIQIQALPKVIQIPRILNPNAATKQSFGPQYLQLSPLTDGQEKKFSIQHLIPYDDDDTMQSAGEKSVGGLTKQNPSDKPMPHVVQIDGKKFLQTLPSTSSLSATEIQSMLSKGNNKVLITMGKTDKLVSLQNNQSVVRLTKTLGLQATQSPTNSIQPPSSSLNLPSDVSKLTTTVTLKEAPSISISNLAEKSVSQPTSVQKVTPPEKVSPFKVVVVSNHAEKTSESTKSHEKSPKVSKGNQTNLPKVTIKTIPKKVSVTDYAENTSDPTNTPKEVSPLETSIMNHHENTSHPTNTPKEVSTLEASIMNHHENTPDPTNTPKEVPPLEASITTHPENTTELIKSPEKTTQQEKTEFEVIEALKNNPEYMLSFGLSFSNDW